ncbi:MAG: ComEC/Rec2 family competence protein [Coraliomargaritaceae bacterium]
MKALERVSVHAPLSYLLAGLLIGLPLSKMTQVPLTALLFFSLLTLLWAHRCTGTKKWYPLFLLAVILAALAYGESRLPAPPDENALRLPAREARLELRILRIYNERDLYGKTSGLATVRKAPWESRLQVGDTLYFRFSNKDPLHQLYCGQRLLCTGILIPIQKHEETDRSFENYLRSIGVYYRFERNGSIQWIESPPKAEVFYRKMNNRFQNTLGLGAPEKTQLAGIYRAMLLGRKNELSTAQREAFTSTGTIHFFAISGLHIGVIALTFAYTLRLLCIPNWLAPWIGLSALFLYVKITGASPSAVRAFLMTGFYWLAFTCRRQSSPFVSLINSAVFVLCLLPRQLWSVGFQLSYCVVASILLLGLPLNQTLGKMYRPYQWLPKSSWNQWHQCIDATISGACLLFSISLSAWLASAPFSAAYFGTFAPGGIFLNMLLVNLASLVIVGGVLSIGLSLLHLDTVAAFINHAAWINLTLMEGLIDQFKKIPGAFFECSAFPVFWAYVATTAYLGLLIGLHALRGKPEKLDSRDGA